MKIGVSAFAWTSNFGLQHLRLLPLMRDEGFDGFEIPMFDPENSPSIDITLYLVCAYRLFHRAAAN